MLSGRQFQAGVDAAELVLDDVLEPELDDALDDDVLALDESVDELLEPESPDEVDDEPLPEFDELDDPRESVL